VTGHISKIWTGFAECDTLEDDLSNPKRAMDQMIEGKALCNNVAPWCSSIKVHFLLFTYRVNRFTFDQCHLVTRLILIVIRMRSCTQVIAVPFDSSPLNEMCFIK